MTTMSLISKNHQRRSIRALLGPAWFHLILMTMEKSEAWHSQITGEGGRWCVEGATGGWGERA